MSLWRRRPAARHDDIRISAIRVAFAVSLLVHALALWTYLPHMRILTPSDTDKGESGSPLAVQLVPKPGPPGSLPASPPPPEPLVALRPPAKSAPPPRAAARPPTPPPVMTAPRQAPNAPALPAAPPQPATIPQPAPVTDLAAYIEARRRERGESTSSSQQPPSSAKAAEDENERQNRIIAANIGLNGQPTFGKDPKNGGGIFQIKTMEYSYAEFYFFGWNKDINRNSKQVIEVRKGNNPDIQIAVIRKMIGIIREHETEDFLWESHRLGRQITLSARARDNAGLESFMLQEFFYDARNPP
jgi:outer membrane biosynthesis protein TonB